MIEKDFGKLGKVQITTLEAEPFDIFAKYTSSPTYSCPGVNGGPSSPFDDDGPCGSPLVTS